MMYAEVKLCCHRERYKDVNPCYFPLNQRGFIREPKAPKPNSMYTTEDLVIHCADPCT